MQWAPQWVLAPGGNFWFSVRSGPKTKSFGCGAFAVGPKSKKYFCCCWICGAKVKKRWCSIGSRQQTEPPASPARAIWCDVRATYGAMLISVGRVTGSINTSVYVCCSLVSKHYLKQTLFTIPHVKQEFSPLLYNHMYNMGIFPISSMN